MSKAMTVCEILSDWLKEHGYDGLSCPECCCDLDTLCWCEELCLFCDAGYKIPCPGPDECNLDGNCDFHIGPDKPEGPSEAQKLLADLDASPKKKTQYIARNGVSAYLDLCDQARKETP